MLRQLSGRTHEVLTAIALADRGGISSSSVEPQRSHLSRDHDRPKPAPTGKPENPGTKRAATPSRDWAPFSSRDLRGSYSGVMGLPLFETAELLQGGGVRVDARRHGAR